MDSSYLGQVKRALGFEEVLQATLIDVFRKHKKLYFRFHHEASGKIWDTVLSKLENYSHNKFSKYNKGVTVGKLLTQEEVLRQFVEAHGDRYDYSLVKYFNSRTKVEIVCQKHGSFWKAPSQHTFGKGCPQCSKTGLNTLHDVLLDFVTTHGDSYDYSKVAYINNRTKVEIVCNKHGSFWQAPDNHQQGNGCPKCAESKKGWSYTDWGKAGNTSNNFDSFKVYIIKCFKGEEVFYKIGKTFHTVSGRFSGNKKLPYAYEVLKVIKGDAREVSELEIALHRLNKETKYTPKISFKGMYECFSELKEETFEA